MTRWLRRLRGAIRTAVTWAVGWAAAGGIFGAVTVVSGIDPASALFWIPATFAAAGFVGGMIFSAVLGLIEGRRTFAQMSLPRFAAWGALGGALVSILIVAMGLVGSTASVVATVMLPLLAAGSASGSLALARGADDKVLESGNESDDPALSEEKNRGLLGR